MATYEGILTALTPYAYIEIAPLIQLNNGETRKRDSKPLFWGCFSEQLKKENIWPQRSAVEMGMPVPCWNPIHAVASKAIEKN